MNVVDNFPMRKICGIIRNGNVASHWLVNFVTQNLHLDPDLCAINGSALKIKITKGVESISIIDFVNRVVFQ